MAIWLGEFEYTEDLLHDYWVFLLKEKQKFDPWLEQGNDIIAANALILLIQRRSAKGSFWGCSSYPECRGIRQVTP